MTETKQSAIEIGNRIIDRLKELGMKQSELAIQIDLDPTQLSRILSGERSMKAEQLVSIAAVLRVPLSYLQPEELDRYSGVPREMTALSEKLKTLPVAERMRLIRMFEAQISSLQG